MDFKEAALHIIKAKHITAFTGAGISVESGIPTFRGSNGLWNQYDPIILDLNYYLNNAKQSWPFVKKLFYDYFRNVAPNNAHKILAKWEETGIIKDVITQNIDNLHQRAGSKSVHEFHGTSENFICTTCYSTFPVSQIMIKSCPPLCPKLHCKGLLKPNFIFFGEDIPELAYQSSLEALQNSDLLIIVGTTGEVMPASQLPLLAHQQSCFIIEINPNVSNYTHQIVDIYLKEKASVAFEKLDDEITSLLTLKK